MGRPRVVFAGSGPFGLPVLRDLGRWAEVRLVVSQPARPAGRGRTMTATPVAEAAAAAGIDVLTPASIDDADAVARILAAGPDLLVVIAYGGRVGRALLDRVPACNLHASLLPRWRGAAPIARCMMAGDVESGLTVIELADRIDAGRMYARRSTPIDPLETAGELHDRLAALGPEVIEETGRALLAGTARGEVQDESRACHAGKLTKEEGTTDFAHPADLVRARIHGLTPWPGCTISVDGARLRLHRVRVIDAGADPGTAPGTLRADGAVACARGFIVPLEVQPAGGRLMPATAWQQGARTRAGARMRPLAPPRDSGAVSTARGTGAGGSS